MTVLQGQRYILALLRPKVSRGKVLPQGPPHYVVHLHVVLFSTLWILTDFFIFQHMCAHEGLLLQKQPLSPGSCCPGQGHAQVGDL
jgi:hypothetical protein